MEEQYLFKQNKISTGIEELDIMLDGGYSNPGSVVLIGPAGIGKAVFAFHFANDGIKKGDAVYYLASDMLPKEVESKSASLGMKLKNGIKYIDCYSATVGVKDESRNDIFIDGPTALNDLSLVVNDAIRESGGKKIRFIFHSFSTFLLYNPQDSILKFFQVVEGRLKAANATLFLLIEKGMHDEKLLNTFLHSIGEVFELEEKDGAYELSSSLLPVNVPVRIGPMGVEII
ncbi:MAG: RAD55 family ATPase [Candidatus Anstonellales archaeon]